MAEGYLPPLILELRAVASQLYAELGKVSAATKTTAAESEAAATRTTRAVEGAAGASEAALSRSAAAWKGLMGIGKIAAVAGVAVAAESVKMASKFQSSMSLLVTAGGESEKNLGKISDGVLNLARATGTSTEQLSEGMYTVEKALNATGASVADKLLVLKAAAEGAKAENVDMATSVNALTSVMMSYHKPAADAVSVQNQMIAASGLAKTTMSEFATSLSNVLPLASGAHISFAQVGGAIATLTQHGTTAQRATDDLANTIRNLQGGNNVATAAMQQLGINVTDLRQKLGQRGLTGTINLITQAISDHLGPSGLIAVDAFKKSQSAAADLNTMIGQMPAGLAKLSQQYLAGSVGLTDYKKAAKGMGGQSAAMGLQFLALAQKAQGFNDMVKAGQPAATTFSDYLKKIMGGATGLTTALMLGGDNMGYFKKATDEVAAAGKKAGANISTWARTQKNFSVQMAQLREDVQTAAIAVGTWLLPKVQAFVGFLTNHTAILYTVGGLIGGFLVAAITAWTAKVAISAAKNIADMAKMGLSAAKWAAAQAKSITDTIRLWGMYAKDGVAKAATATASKVSAMASSIGGWVTSTASKIGQVIADFARYVAQGIAKAAAATAAKAASMASSIAGFAADLGRQVGKMIASGVAWTVEHGVMAASYIAENLAMAASATAAFVAENAATLGIGVAIAAVVAAVVWLATHWSQAWGAITAAAKWAYDNVIKPVGSWIMNNVLHPIAEAAQWLQGVWTTVWNAIGDALKWVYDHTIGPIVGVIKDAVGGVMSVVHGIGSAASAVGHFLGFANGGIVPGPIGQPMLAVVHGGEYVLSRDMLARRQEPTGLLDAADDANGYTAAAPPSRPAMAGAAATATAGAGLAGSVVNNNVTVNAQTNASATRIASEAGWILRTMM